MTDGCRPGIHGKQTPPGLNLFKSPMDRRLDDADFKDRVEYYHRIMAGEIVLHRVRLDITRACVFKCKYCFSRLGDYSGIPIAANSIPAAAIKSLCAEFKKLNVKIINLYGGGEPTLHPDFYNVLGLLSETGAAIRIITNGVGLLDNCEKALYDFRKTIHQIRFSFHGVDDASYREITGTPYFEKILARVTSFLSRIKDDPGAPEVGIYVPVVKDYQEESIRKFVEHFRPLKVDWVLFREDTRMPRELDEKVSRGAEHAFPNVKKALAHIAEDLNNFPLHYHTPVKTPNAALNCYYRLTDIVLSYEPASGKLIMVSCEHHTPAGVTEIPPEGTYELVAPSSLSAAFGKRLAGFLKGPEKCPRPDHCYAAGHNLKIEQSLLHNSTEPLSLPPA